MAIAEEFAGLDMGQLIGAPLDAAANASITLARGTSDFINQVGFDKDGKTRTSSFSYQRRTMNDDGTSNLESMNVDIPLLAIVPIPNLQIDEVNVIFDMEVKQSEKSDKSLDIGASLTGSVGWGPFKVSVTGSVSAHESNTRSSDNSAKYHVDVRATNHGTPEGLARVLDMIAAGISPSLVSSELRDENGQTLPESSKAKAERLAALRVELQNLERAKDANSNLLETKIKLAQDLADKRRNKYNVEAGEVSGNLLKEINDPSISDEEKKKKEAELSSLQNAINTINTSWSNFISQTREKLQLVVDSGKTGAEALPVFALKVFDAAKSDAGYISDYTDADSDFTASTAQAEDSLKKLYEAEKNLSDKQSEYSTVLASPAGAAYGKTEHLTGNGKQSKIRTF